MGKGKLTQVDKYAIKGMLAEGRTVSEIEAALDRVGGVSVKNYIVGELDDIVTTVVKARLSRVENGEEEEEVFEDIYDNVEESEEKSSTGNKVISSRELIQKRLDIENNPILLDETLAAETLVKLHAIGMKGVKAGDLLNRSKKLLNRPPKDAEEMFRFCLRQLNILDNMITTTNNPRDDSPTVAIMTAAASAAAEDRAKNRTSKASRPVSGNVFRPKNGDFK